MPGVAGVALKRAAIESFQEHDAPRRWTCMIVFNVLFAGIIAFGVVYNTARISLSERSRELASLRVLGFTRAEISLHPAGRAGACSRSSALPLGLLMGYRPRDGHRCRGLQTELYRFPLVIGLPAPTPWRRLVDAARRRWSRACRCAGGSTTSTWSPVLKTGNDPP